VALVRWFVFLLFALVLSSPLAAAVCTDAMLPKATLTPTSGIAVLGRPLNGTFIARQKDVTVGAAPLNPSENFTFNASSGRFLFTPMQASGGRARLLFYAVSTQGCVASWLADFEIRRPPVITALPDADVLTLDEGEGSRFAANATPTALVAWLLDGHIVDRGNTSFLYHASFNDSGNHTIIFRAESDNLSANKTWSVVVNQVNRPPFQIARIIGLALFVNTSVSANLSAYFLDPDGQRLTYSSQVKEPSALVEKGQVALTFVGEEVSVFGVSPGKAFISFVATDTEGASVQSEAIAYSIFSGSIATSPSYCGDGVCLSPENCTACARDCGACKAPVCTPAWECAPWSACSPSGYQFRTCKIANDCTNGSTSPAESQKCTYEASCADGLKNGNESGVDCGGSCPPCPTCEDGSRNQGEEGIDCGGLCVACPTCKDDIQNQQESDVDCGGPCAACPENGRCFSDKDCLSYSCRRGLCIAPSCSDGVRNQAEMKVDCGGPCSPCPSCSDGVRNQAEEKVDCGGPCAACPSCVDRIKNQEESLTDCGGPCRTCGLREYLPTIIRAAAWALAILVCVLLFYLARSIFFSRMLFLFTHGKAIHFFYEDEPTYALVKRWNGLARHLRVRRHKTMRDMVLQTRAELSDMRNIVPENALRPAIKGKLRALYAEMLGLPLNFEFDTLVRTVRHSSLPFSVKVIVLRNTKVLAILELTKLYSDGSFALADVLRAMEELERAF
jgi:hypothetical protein